MHVWHYISRPLRKLFNFKWSINLWSNNYSMPIISYIKSDMICAMTLNSSWLWKSATMKSHRRRFLDDLSRLKISKWLSIQISPQFITAFQILGVHSNHITITHITCRNVRTNSLFIRIPPTSYFCVRSRPTLWPPFPSGRTSFFPIFRPFLLGLTLDTLWKQLPQQHVDGKREANCSLINKIQGM